MFTTLLSVALLATSTLAFKVTVPDTAAQCGDMKIKWDSDNDGPYYVEILNPEKPCEDALITLGDHDGSSMTWYGISLVTGTKIQVYVESEKDEGWSSPITVTDGLQDCLAQELWSTSATPSSTPASSEEAASSSVAVVDSSSAFVATPSVIAVSSSAPSSAPASSSSAPAIVGAAGAGLGQGDGALSVKASGSIIALSVFVAGFALL